MILVVFFRLPVYLVTFFLRRFARRGPLLCWRGFLRGHVPEGRAVADATVLPMSLVLCSSRLQAERTLDAEAFSGLTQPCVSGSFSSRIRCSV